MNTEKGSLSIHSENIFPIIKKWLYSDHDIFIRELVSNATDAIKKLKKLDAIGEYSIPENTNFAVEVLVDNKNKTITVKDNGIGMTADEVKKYINQIAFSGAEDFLNTYKDKDNTDQIIGHFGLGFYSAFMVAERVEINSLSYQADATPIHWECDGGTEFSLQDGDKTEVGTDIILHIGDDGKSFLNSWTLRTTIEKYCSFMPYPIYLTNVNQEPEKDEDGNIVVKEPKALNDSSPLYLKKSGDCSDEDYKKFFRDTFHDYKEPLFWIHLNMDYPFRLKGILYFPRLGNEFDNIEGQIKLYNSQVFIADNIKEVIPEFLLLLKGVIDCPDLPLNVSRSFLQNDGFVRKISDYITKKVADKLNSLFNKDRSSYQKYWKDIHPFIKFGCLRDDKFYEKTNQILLFEDLSGNLITTDEYLKQNYPQANPATDGSALANAESTDSDFTGAANDAKQTTANSSDNPTDVEQAATKSVKDTTDESTAAAQTTDESTDSESKPEPKTIYYVTDPAIQSQYINLFQSHDMNAVILNHSIDQPFINHMEMRNPEFKFARIDANITDNLKQDDQHSEEEAKAFEADLTDVFKKALSNKELKVRVESLKSADVSAIMLLSEESRRLHDMSKMYGMMGMDMGTTLPTEETLVLNKNNPLVQYIFAHKDNLEQVSVFCQQLYDLALLSHKPLPADKMTDFIKRSNQILAQLSDQ